MSYPCELIRQARELSRTGGDDETQRGHPRQADLRAAVSASYYALFHALTAAASQRVAGTTGSPQLLGAVAHSFQPRQMLEASEEVARPTLRKKYTPLFAGCTRSDALRDVASAFVVLQARRHAADYGLEGWYRREEAADTIDLAEDALEKVEALFEQRDDALDRYLFALHSLWHLRG